MSHFPSRGLAVAQMTRKRARWRVWGFSSSTSLPERSSALALTNAPWALITTASPAPFTPSPPPGRPDGAGPPPPPRAGPADATPAADWLDATGLPGEPG